MSPSIVAGLLPADVAPVAVMPAAAAAAAMELTAEFMLCGRNAAATAACALKYAILLAVRLLAAAAMDMWW